MKKTRQEKAPRKPRVLPARISWLMSRDRVQPSAVAREAHLRSLMGLPAQRSAALDDERDA